MIGPDTFERAWSWLLPATFQASVVVVLVLVIQRLLRPVLSPRWMYFLWMLVIARLLIPFGPASRFSIFNLTRGLFPGEAPPPHAMVPEVMFGPPPPLPAAAEPGQGVLATLVPWLVGLWLLGVVFLVVRGLGRSLVWRLRLRGLPRVEDPAVLAALDASRRAMGVRRRVTLHESNHVSSPSLVGILRPRLLLPGYARGGLFAAELRLVFQHELAHLKQWDLLWNALLSLLKCLHWFNPLIWLAQSRCRTDQELACDAVVLSRATPEERQRYGLTILKVVERMTRARPLPGLVALLKGTDEIERRIHMIAGYRRLPRSASMVGLAAFLALACVGLSSATPAAHECQQECCQKKKHEEKVAQKLRLHLEGGVRLDARQRKKVHEAMAKAKEAMHRAHEAMRHVHGLDEAHEALEAVDLERLQELLERHHGVLEAHKDKLHGILEAHGKEGLHKLLKEHGKQIHEALKRKLHGKNQAVFDGDENVFFGDDQDWTFEFEDGDFEFDDGDFEFEFDFEDFDPEVWKDHMNQWRLNGAEWKKHLGTWKELREQKLRKEKEGKKKAPSVI